MKNFKEFLSSKSITDEDYKGKTAEEMTGLYIEYSELKEKEKAELIESKASKEDIDKINEELNNHVKEQLKTITEAYKAQGIVISKMSASSAASEEKGLFVQIKEQLDSHLDGLKAMKAVKNTRGFQIKAAGSITSANISGGDVPQAQRINTFDIIASRRVRLLDIVSRGVASSNLLEWVSQASKDGSAGQTAEGALKNQIDFDIVVDSEKIKKTTAWIKVTTEMLDDVDFIMSEINNELIRETLKQVELGVYSGDGTGENLNGIKTVASAFVAATAPEAVDNANFVDVLRTANTQIELAEHDGANYILANPSDVLGLLQIKASTTDKRYIDALQMVAGQLSLDGIPIIKTTLVAQDSYLIGDFSRAFVYDKGEISISVGLDSDDFTKNFRTILAEWRGASVVKTNDRTAFVTGTISVDATALIAL